MSKCSFLNVEGATLLYVMHIVLSSCLDGTQISRAPALSARGGGAERRAGGSCRVCTSHLPPPCCKGFAFHSPVGLNPLLDCSWDQRDHADRQQEKTSAGDDVRIQSDVCVSAEAPPGYYSCRLGQRCTSARRPFCQPEERSP